MNIVDFYDRLADLFDAFGLLLNRSDRDLAVQVRSGYFFILSFLILLLNVLGLIPSNSAAPSGP